jgi:hypothetical protein
MRYTELVTELYNANAAFELEWNDTFGPEERSARARDSRGGYIDIKFVPVANGIVEVEFSRNDSYDVTGEGEASRVLATVLEAFRDYLRGYQPKILIFASKGQSRTKLYQSLINRFASSVGYQQFDINKLKPETREKISMSGSDVMVLRKTATAESTKDSGDTMRYNNIIPENFDKNAYDQEDYFVVRQQSERDKENNTPSKFWDQVSRHDSLGDAQQTIEKLRQQNPNNKFSYTMHRRTQGLAENAEELNIGDDVIITGDVEFQGKTGMIADFGDMKRFVVVDLYNHGKHSFHSSDVSYNDYADSDDERRDSMGEGAIITKDDLVDIYIKGKGKNNMPIQKKIGAQIPNSKVESFIAAVADKYGLNPKAFVYGPSKSMSEDAAGVGVVASKKQKNDPRYSMSLTKDVRPGEVARNMKKLHLEGNRGYNHGFASPTAPSLGRRGREDDEYHVPDPTPATWYIRANGKIIKDKMGSPFQFRDKEAARKAAMTMMSKPFNAGKKFVLTTRPEDEQPVAEAGKGISKDAETKFHAKLDQLVHDTFGKRKSEKK